MISYLKTFLIQNAWDDDYAKEQSRAIFTTICLMENIDADTAECDYILALMYDACIVPYVGFDSEEYENFKGYMLELIV